MAPSLPASACDRHVALQMANPAERRAAALRLDQGLLAELLPDAREETWWDASHVIAGKEQKMRLDALLRSFYAGVGELAPAT